MADVFVIMPFGVKVAEQRGQIEKFDFDHIYRKLIAPACASAGLSVGRIDEVLFSGAINSEIIKHLVSSELIIADLTTANPNVYFELGIRQSLTERPTILIANNGTELPFNINNQRVEFYQYSADQFSEADVAKLSNAVAHAHTAGARSPIRSLLREYGILVDPRDRSAFEADLRNKITRATSLEQLAAIWYWAAEQSPLPAYTLLDLAERIADCKDWQLAARIGARTIAEKSGDFLLHRRYGWFLRNAGPDHYAEAEGQFRVALQLNSADPETLGMLGGLYKRMKRFQEAVQCYDKGMQLSPGSLYMRTARAAMTLLSEINQNREPDEGRARYQTLFDEVLKKGASQTDAWSLAILGEASFVLGRKAEAVDFFKKASRLSDSPTVLGAPADQIELFGTHGFRAAEAGEIVAILRPQARTVEVATRVEDVRAASEEQNDHLPTIVHLSDIHFGSRVDKNGAVQVMHRFVDGDYSQSLSKHLRAELIKPEGRFRLVGKPVSIVASGDFAYTATRNEFDEATALFEKLRDELQLKPEQFVFCPGNHDVSWAHSRIDKSTRFDFYLSFLRKFYGEALFKELYPLVNWDFSVDGQRPKPSDLVSVHYNKDQGLLFASFNSCVYETEQHHYGFVSLSQQQNVTDLLEKVNVSGDVVRVAVVHHHLHPYPDFVGVVGTEGHWLDMSTIRDGGLFERFLEKHGFDLVLHGHKHRPQLRETIVRDRNSQDQIKPLIVCGAGSCGVEKSELDHSTGNQFQVLEFVSRRRLPRAEFLRIEWREIAVQPDAEWATTRVWNVLGG